MKLRFVHASDIHLGYEQYSLPARSNDFARAYLDGVVQHAIEVQPDFVIIAGDLFHRANTDAWTLKQATIGLVSLRSAGIPVVAIEGNHDAQHYHKHLSWMEFLCDQELLCLLNVERADNGYRSLVPFDVRERHGSWIDVAGARIYGVKYHGAAISRVLDEIVGQIEPNPDGYTIFMLHAGLEGQVPHMHGGLTMGQLDPIRPAVDYLALGHVHKRVTVDDWVFNPGSTEINSMEEMDWPHGFFDVTVDTDGSPKHVVVPIETPTLRPFRRLSVVADGCLSSEEFAQRVEAAIAESSGIPRGAVIDLHLGGVSEFKRQDVPVDRLKGAVETRLGPLTVRVTNKLVPPGIVRVTNKERLSRTELEREVIERLVYQHAEYRDRAAAWARLILDVKNMAVEKDLPANIADHVRQALARSADQDDATSSSPEAQVTVPIEPSPGPPEFEDW